MHLATKALASLHTSASASASSVFYLGINAGSTAANGTWSADTDYSGGTTSASPATINTSGAPSPAPQFVYKSHRYGSTVTYVIPNLTPASAYTLRVHFAETWFTAQGKRVFSIFVNGSQVLTNLDIFATAGGANKAIVEEMTAAPDATGKLTIKFVASVNNASIAGIEIEGTSSASPSPSPSATPGSVSGLPAIANQVMWYDAADSNSLVTSGKLVTQWADRSGSGNTLYQGSATSQPTVVTAAINGLPALSFSGAQTLGLTSPNVGTSTSYSFFVAAKNGAPATYQSILGGTYEAGAGEFGLGSTAAGAGRIVLTNGTVVATGTSSEFSTAPTVIEGLMSSGSTDALYHTGNLDSATSMSTALRSLSSINLGSEPGASNFSGSLGEVIVYNRVLTTSERQVVEGYLAWKWGLQTQLPASHPFKLSAPTVQLATPAPQSASPADAMVDSIGINTHFAYSNTGYQYLTSSNPAPNGQTVLSSLQTLGVRHLRDGINLANPASPAYCAAMRQAYANGSDFDLIVGATDTTAFWSANLACLNSNSAVKSFEGLNEYVNGGNDPTDLATDVAMSKQMFNARASGILPNVPLIAPSQTSCEAYLAELNYSSDVIATYFDYNNSHGYFGEYNPETGPWGGLVCGLSAGYGTMAYQIQNSSLPAQQKPLIVTETGYSNGCCGNTDTNQTVDNATQAKYVLRTYLGYYAAGVKYTYLYELANDSQSFGLLDNQLNPKPAYRALANFIRIMKDPGGSSIRTTPLHYDIAAPSTMKELLFQKRDGSYWLALWKSDASFNVSANVPITVAPSTVQITLSTTPSALIEYTLNATDGSVSTTTLTPSTSITLAVTDTPQIVQIGATTSAPVTLAVGRYAGR